MSPRFRLFGRSQPGSPVQWLIVGLGNPGRKYSGNRHNAGFHVVDRLAAACGLHFDSQRSRALLAQGQIEGVRVALVKPQTYMNRSGEAVGGVARFFKVPPEQVLVIYDELDLPLGTLRLRPKGGAGGHQGMANVIAHLNTQDFPRLRIGIGRPPGQLPPEAYVLQDYGQDQKPVIEQTYQRAVEAVRVVLSEGLEMALNLCNREN
jgi:PTH1 family peptidyl-tRNA hydrolase